MKALQWILQRLSRFDKVTGLWNNAVNLDSSLFEDNTATTVLSVTLPAEEFALIRFQFYFLLFF